MHVITRNGRTVITHSLIDSGGNTVDLRFAPGTTGANLIVRKNGRKALEVSIPKSLLETVIANFR